MRNYIDSTGKLDADAYYNEFDRLSAELGAEERNRSDLKWS